MNDWTRRTSCSQMEKWKKISKWRKWVLILLITIERNPNKSNRSFSMSVEMAIKSRETSFWSKSISHSQRMKHNGFSAICVLLIAAPNRQMNVNILHEVNSIERFRYLNDQLRWRSHARDMKIWDDMNAHFINCEINLLCLNVEMVQLACRLKLNNFRRTR